MYTVDIDETVSATPAYDGFERMADTINRDFLRLGKAQLYTTSIGDELWNIYLSGIEYRYRKYYDCNCCKSFIRNFGHLVTIDEGGNTRSAIWRIQGVPPMFRDSLRNMIAVVEKAPVTGLFTSEEKSWGVRYQGGWEHFYITNRNVYSSRTKTPYQWMAERKEEYGMVTRALADYTKKTVDTALSIVESESLANSQVVLGPIKWLSELRQTVSRKRGHRPANLIWRAIAEAPAGFTHVRSGMSGTLLDDIKSGISFKEVKRRFDEKMHPLKYMRTQTPAKSGAINRAEKLVDQLGLRPSLERRFAHPSEVSKIWNPRPTKARKPGVFSHLHQDPTTMHTNNKRNVTWAKFQRDILPKADKIEYMVSSFPKPYSVMLTEENAGSPLLFQWSNPFSTYQWHGGSRPQSMGLTTGWRHVVGVTELPHMWSDDLPQRHKGVIFLLEGARETRMNGNALFPSTFRGELHEVRSVIENFSKEARIHDNYRNEHAIGITITKNVSGETFRVTTGNVSVLYNIDRWD